ncbi:glycoside hydrolase family 9 protein [Actinoplanes sp. ATCC 53533]|uniref:glycoside hydrolase family 9 protein n=1 Tax=Actinoplanes sp. ATCC 53533 TaxID=1288362 RepID=UPI000F79C020|nr:glycoside hydrolase family 9 protein [Actinoplanes sp. ATCC 53533]
MLTAAVRRRPLALLSIGAMLVAGACGSPPKPPLDAFVRLDQLGYAPAETKIAVLLAPRDAAGARAAVVGADGRTVLSLTVGSGRGGWNATFTDVRPIDLTALTRPGTYRLRIDGPVHAESPPFRIGTANELFGSLAQESVEYFQAHRDGANQVSARWKREPAHLADRAATVYERPAFDDGGRLTAGLLATAGPVDVEGGWYDAGDFLKFTHTTAYALIAMQVAQRDGATVGGLAAEARHGLDWLGKMWDPNTGTLYTQVGIGSGLQHGDETFLGDHDTWRLPQDDDRLAVQPGDERYYQRYRPVFRAADPGERLSPNLAGRVAAAFALAAQLEAATEPARARAHLTAAARIFGLAATEGVENLVTAEPRTFYPEDSWTDDMALGATELALAGRVLGDPRAGEWLEQATHWAKTNTDRGDDGALSVYNLSALAITELTRATGAEIDTGALRRDLRRRLDAGVQAAAGNPMGAAAGNGGADYAARQLGYTATAELYEHTFQDGRYAAFATAQRGVVLGANGWGTSMVVGAGTTYPRCPHDQIATLAGSPATAAGMVGAVVNGPNHADRVHEILADPRPTSCASNAFAPFDRDDIHYVDDMRVSANNEPSIDFTATGLLAFALTAKQH